MPDFDQKHPADDEKAAQQVRPPKPERAGQTNQGDPNETPPGRPQHAPSDPDNDEW
jgi:hypothetical protein